MINATLINKPCPPHSCHPVSQDNAAWPKNDSVLMLQHLPEDTVSLFITEMSLL